MIVAHDLTRRFGSRTVVNGVSFEVGRSEIVALLGPNGAGKTTTLRMLAGLIAPTSGSIVVDGVRLTRSTGARLRSRIGFLTETPGLWDRLTVTENLRVYARLYGLDRPDRVVDRVVEVFRELYAESDQDLLMCSQRKAFQPLYPTTELMTAVTYNLAK